MSDIGERYRYVPVIEVWQYRGDQWRTLDEPYGPPTERQLAFLEERGLLDSDRPPATKLTACWLIDEAIESE